MKCVEVMRRKIFIYPFHQCLELSDILLLLS